MYGNLLPAKGCSSGRQFYGRSVDIQTKYNRLFNSRLVYKEIKKKKISPLEKENPMASLANVRNKIRRRGVRNFKTGKFFEALESGWMKVKPINSTLLFVKTNPKKKPSE